MRSPYFLFWQLVFYIRVFDSTYNQPVYIKDERKL